MTHEQEQRDQTWIDFWNRVPAARKNELARQSFFAGYLAANNTESVSLLNKLQDYKNGNISLVDDAEVFEIVANLPIVRDLQNKNSKLRSEICQMAELYRFLKNDAEGFVKIWQAFQEIMETNIVKKDEHNAF